MDAKLLQTICKEIYRRDPQVMGRRPRIQAVPLPVGKAAVGPAAGRPAHLLVFESQGLTVDQRKITTLVRVVVDRNGKILKVSASR